jgi:hypothetical protein
MFRELCIATAIAAAAISAAPAVTADDKPGRYDGDVPGMNYDANLSGPCDSWERFVFGRGPGGEPLSCRFIPNQWPPVYWGFWTTSYPLYGVQAIAAPCPDWRGAAAQSPDGLALICTLNDGWQVRP